MASNTKWQAKQRWYWIDTRPRFWGWLLWPLW